MPAQELTGRRRYKKYVLRYIVDHEAGFRRDRPVLGLLLQVEVSVWAAGREDKPGRWVCQWRDATQSDVQKGELA